MNNQNHPSNRAELEVEHTLHHTAYFRGYISRKGNATIKPYQGKFGTGYTRRYNDGTSSQYSRVEYWIKK